MTNFIINTSSVESGYCVALLFEKEVVAREFKFWSRQAAITWANNQAQLVRLTNSIFIGQEV